MVVRKNETGKESSYLASKNERSDERLDVYEYFSYKKEDAWNYSSSVAFDDADRLGGKVFLRTKIREIEVTREDFGYE